ncbi:MAG: sensor histidine kinase [bacterium]
MLSDLKNLTLLDEVSSVLLKRHDDTASAIDEILKTIQDFWPFQPARIQILFDDNKFESGPQNLKNKMYSSQFLNCFIGNDSSANSNTHELLNMLDKKLELFFDYIKYEQRLNKAMAHKLSMLEEKQRREIASDLHDHLGQALAMMKIKLKTLRGNAIFCGLDDIVNDLVTLTDQSISYTRTLTAELVPPTLYELGLVPALEWLTESSKKKYKLDIDFIGLTEMPKLSDEYNIIIFRVVNELLMNVVKHASASKINIKMEKISDKQVLIHVLDNGVGFDMQKRFKNIQEEHNCFGILSSRERLAYNGGRLLIESSIGKGTHATIEVNV